VRGCVARVADLEVRGEAIGVQVGKSGILAPVAVPRPVPLAGVVIARGTLHAEDEIRWPDIREGDVVLLERAGDVVPHVVTVVRGGRPRRAQRGGFPGRCAGVACPAQLEGPLRRLGSRRAMDIEGLAPATVADLVERGVVADVPDLYRPTVPRVARLAAAGVATHARRPRSCGRVGT